MCRIILRILRCDPLVCVQTLHACIRCTCRCTRYSRVLKLTRFTLFDTCSPHVGGGASRSGPLAFTSNRTQSTRSLSNPGCKCQGLAVLLDNSIWCRLRSRGHAFVPLCFDLDPRLGLPQVQRVCWSQHTPTWQSSSVVFSAIACHAICSAMWSGKHLRYTSPGPWE